MPALTALRRPAAGILVAGLVATDYEAATSHAITLRETLAGAIESDGSGPLSGTQPQVFHTATSLTEANSVGGIPNRGSFSSLPMVKIAGTYT